MKNSVRLLHITDIHFGPPHDDALDDAIRGLIAREAPDALLVSGDLTQRAKADQFEAARAYLSSLSLPQVVVPGNHDVPLYALHERLGDPFGRFRKHFAPDLEPTLQLDRAWIFGMNTAKGWTMKNGVFREETLARMERFFADAPREALRVVVAHHHLLPAPGVVYDPVAARAREAAEALSRARVDVLLGGHLHHTFVQRLRDFYPGLAWNTWVAHAGTSMSTRGRRAEHGMNTVNLLDFDGAHLKLVSLRHDGGHFLPAMHYAADMRSGR